MGKRIASIALICLFSYCIAFSYSKPETIPQWMEELRLVYPLNEYFAQIGEGNTLATAKNNATSKIANYFESTVQTNTESNYSIINENGTVEKSQAVSTSTKVTSDVTLFALEYSDSYYSKKEKKYYICAYIVRQTLWDQYVPIIEDAKSIFYGFIQKADKENDSFLKISYLEDALKYSEDFLFKLNYGRVISPEHESQFSSDRFLIASLPSKIQEIKKNISFSIEVQNDYLNTISSVIKKEILDLSYKTNLSKDATYFIKGEILYNQTTDEDLIVLNPVLKIHLYNDYKDLMNYELVSDEVVAASLDYAKQFAIKDLKEKLEMDFRKRMEKIYDKK